MVDCGLLKLLPNQRLVAISVVLGLRCDGLLLPLPSPFHSACSQVVTNGLSAAFARMIKELR